MGLLMSLTRASLGYKLKQETKYFPSLILKIVFWELVKVELLSTSDCEGIFYETIINQIMVLHSYNRNS